MRKLLISAVSLLVGVCLTLADDPKPPPPPVEFKKTLPDENDALTLAATDQATLSHEQQLKTRYLWVTDPYLDTIQMLAHDMNKVASSTVLVAPSFDLARPSGFQVLGKDALIVVRVNLEAYWPRQVDLDSAVKMWELLQFDPRFNLLLTADTLKFAGVQHLIPKQTKTVKKKIKVTTQKTDPKDGHLLYYLDDKGKPDLKRPYLVETEVEREEIVDAGRLGKDVVVLRIVSEFIDKDTIATLIQRAQSQAPIVNHRYFHRRVSTTIQGRVKGDLQEVIYGGLYYQFSGIKRGFKKGTDFDNYLQRLGIGNVEAGIDSGKVFDDTPSDARILRVKSGITDKTRMIEVLPTLTKLVDQQGLLAITHDVFDEDIDVGTDALLNLARFKDLARETIAVKPNGLQEYAAWNGNGELQDEVPFNVANDTTIPDPRTKRLQPSISCESCHLAKQRGWQVAINDATKLLKRNRDLFNDTGFGKKTAAENVSRLAGQYSGDLEFKTFPRARDDLTAAILKETGPWKASKDQLDIANLLGEKIGREYNTYVGVVTAADALHDLGYTGQTGWFGNQIGDAPDRLTSLLPPVEIVPGEIQKEDGRIFALEAGIGINRHQYDLVYSFVATRVKGRK